jgi:hypothetical protein
MELGRLELPERSSLSPQTLDDKVWTHPVVANGKLYLRYHDLLFCFDLRGGCRSALMRSDSVGAVLAVIVHSSDWLPLLC